MQVFIGSGVTNWLGRYTPQPGSNAIPVVAWQGTNRTETNVTVYMPSTDPQVFRYDANGNLTNDGERVYSWDDENRLISIETMGHRGRICTIDSAEKP